MLQLYAAQGAPPGNLRSPSPPSQLGTIPLPMVEPTRKALKEQFVSNLTGGSTSEIYLVTAVAPVSYILFAALQSRLRLFDSYGALPLLLDAFLNAGTILLSTTLYASQPLLLNILLLSPALLLYAVPVPSSSSSSASSTTKTRSTGKHDAPAAAPTRLPRKAFLTVYRGSMMVITCIAILAVDFRVFPRRFAKVENWGTSLMDLGVGSFVFSGGLVSARSILLSSPSSGSTSTSLRLGARMKIALRSSVPLLVLGLVRLAMVKGVDYAEHVTEYGVHWNFFFTLGLLPPFVALLQSLAPSASAPASGSRSFVADPAVVYTALALLVGCTYQAVLLGTGLQEYILVGDRHLYGLLSQNKEGASSFFGYLSIFLAGLATGCYVLPSETSTRGGSGKRKGWGLGKLAAWTTFWGVLFYLLRTAAPGNVTGVSRRLANLSYVLWVVVFNSAQLLAFASIERVWFGRATGNLASPSSKKSGKGTRTEAMGEERRAPWVLEAWNRNGLVLFLVANLLTGAVNVGVDTLAVGSRAAVGIVAAYVSVITAVALALDVKGWTVKL